MSFLANILSVPSLVCPPPNPLLFSPFRLHLPDFYRSSALPKICNSGHGVTWDTCAACWKWWTVLPAWHRSSAETSPAQLGHSCWPMLWQTARSGSKSQENLTSGSAYSILTQPAPCRNRVKRLPLRPLLRVSLAQRFCTWYQQYVVLRDNLNSKI